MKSAIKLFFIAIILLFFNKISNAQIEEHYHSFWAIIAIPVIVDHQEAYQPNKGDKKEKHIPDKPIYISLHIKVEDMNVNENNFSGISIEKSAGHDDIKTFHGEVSEDKQMIEYIEITRDYILYSIPDRERAYIENKTTVSIRIEDIPFYFGQYKYKYGVSKITSVKYKEEYVIKRYGGTQSHTDNFVKVDDEKINKYSSCISLGFKPGVLKPEQVTHITIEGPDTVCRCVEKKQGLKKPFRIKLSAKSDIMAGSFKWECDNDAILLMTTKGNGSEIRIRALAEYLPSPNSVLIKVTQKIGVVECSATHVLHLRGGYYYFWPDCKKLFEMGIITKAQRDECEDDFDKCEDSLRIADVYEKDDAGKYILVLKSDKCNQFLDMEYLPLILQEHLLSASELADPDFKLDSEKLNWYYKLWDKNGNPYPEEERAQPRDFIKVMPCMEKWSGL